MALTNMTIQKAEPKEKPYKIADGGGLYLEVLPSGVKSWRMKYRHNFKERRLVIGKYPTISLADARSSTIQAKALLAQGIDPAAKKQEAIKANKAQSSESEEALNFEREATLKFIALEWYADHEKTWVPAHGGRILARLERDLFPSLGDRQLVEIEAQELIKVIRLVSDRGAIETAHRLLQNCGQIWRHAVARGKAKHNIAADLTDALPPVVEGSFAAITTPSEIGQLLRDIDEYKGSQAVRYALKLYPYLSLRPGELRMAKWDEFDLEKNEWTIPAARMKMKKIHIVPLARQVVELLKELKSLFKSDYLFPSPRSATRPLSDTAVLNALRAMGYEQDKMTVHGFRAMASTNLEQLGFDVRLIELHLAHADANEVRAAYKRDTSRLQFDNRITMSQAWADWLDVQRKIHNMKGVNNGS